MCNKPKPCSICLKSSPNLIRASETDSNNVKLSCKLKFCVPEVEWNENCCICNICTDQLNAACSFRNLCLQTNGAHMQQADSHNYQILSVELENNENSNGISAARNKNTANTNYDYKSDYTCYLCNEKFSKKSNLVKHIRLHSANHCDLCKEQFTTSMQLQLHNIQAHGERAENPSECRSCSRTFKSLISLNQHIKRMHQTKEVNYCEDTIHSNISSETYKKTEGNTENLKIENTECDKNACSSPEMKLKVGETYDDFNDDECFSSENYDPDLASKPNQSVNFELPNNDNSTFSPAEFKQKTELKSCRKIRNRAKFYCEECKNVFLSSKKLLNHAVSTHGFDPSLIKPFGCDKCDSKFSSSSNLLQHKKYHTGKRTHICTFCGKGYITKSDLNTHEKQHLNKREYQCAGCPKTFNTNKDLRSHRLVVHTDPSLWNYVCTFCQKRFPIKSNLDQHMRRHTGEKRFGCHICEKRFVDKIVLQKHIKSHSNFRAFKCEHCEKEYKDNRVLEVHLTKVHGVGNAKIPVRVKKYFCHVCPKSYFAKNKLTRHMFSHTGEKPYVCHICDRKFTDKSYVKQHLKATHNVFEIDENK